MLLIADLLLLDWIDWTGLILIRRRDKRIRTPLDNAGGRTARAHARLMAVRTITDALIAHRRSSAHVHEMTHGACLIRLMRPEALIYIARAD